MNCSRYDDTICIIKFINLMFINLIFINLIFFFMSEPRARPPSLSPLGAAVEIGRGWVNKSGFNSPRVSQAPV